MNILSIPVKFHLRSFAYRILFFQFPVNLHAIEIVWLGYTITYPAYTINTENIRQAFMIFLSFAFCVVTALNDQIRSEEPF